MVLGRFRGAFALALIPWLVSAADDRNGVLSPPIELTVQTGGEVQFELRALFTARPGLFGGGVARETDFRLLVPPRFGSIQDLRQLPLAGDRDAAMAVYRHNGESGGLVDGAQFEVRDARDGSVLSKIVVTINILRAVLSVEPHGRLWLGECVVGDRSDGVIAFENKGGAALSFRVAAWRPFYVEGGPRDLYVGPGARVPVTFSFQPEEAGIFETPLILKPELVADYKIEAKAIEAVVLSTNYLDFGMVQMGSEGPSGLRLQNRSRSARDVEIQVSGPFLMGAARMRVPELGEMEVPVTYRPTTTGPAIGWLVMREGRSVQRCQLSGHARLGPILAIEGERMRDLGVVTGLDGTVSHQVLLTNRGDVSWDGLARGTPFFMPGLTSLHVEPSQSRAVGILYKPMAFGAHTGVVAFVGQTTVQVTLAASSVMPSAASPPPSPTRYSAPPIPDRGATNDRPIDIPAAPSFSKAPESSLLSVSEFDLDKLPVFEPPNFRAAISGERRVIIEWDPLPDLPLERLDLYERRFLGSHAAGAGIVWSRRPEIPTMSGDGKTASVALHNLPLGGVFEFAIAEVDAGDKPVRRTPIVEVETPDPRQWRPPWKAIIIAACIVLIALHFFGASLKRLLKR